MTRSTNISIAILTTAMVLGATGCRCNSGDGLATTQQQPPTAEPVDAEPMETVAQPAKRGSIRDSRGRALATSRVARSEQTEYSRIYPMGKVGAHVVGYMDGSTGKGGIEEKFDSTLAGKPGWSKSIPVDGLDVHTTLDSELMTLVHKSFSQHDAGAAVVIEVDSGRVLSLYSKPSFDPTSMTRSFTDQQREEIEADPLLPLLDRTIGEPLTPASTFKTFTALAALQSGAVTPTDTVTCKGSVTVGDEKMTCHGKHGQQTVVDCITVSCNACFYQLGLEVGLDPLFDLYRSLGFGTVTGIDLPAEASGFLPGEEFTVSDESGPLLTASTASGHGPVKVTLLQLALAYAAVINGGDLYRPLLVEKTTGPSNTVVEKFEPQIASKLPIADEVRSTLIEAMTSVLSSEKGTAYGLGQDDLAIGGKSGTDQLKSRVVPPDHEGDDPALSNNAFFVAFAPAAAPKVLVVVLVEDGVTGGRTAGPVAVRILSEYMAGLD